MNKTFDNCLRVALAVTLLAGFSLMSARGDLQPPSEFTLAVSGADINIRFGTVAGQTYAVEKSTTLAPSDWTAILGNVSGTGTVQTAADAGAASLPKCFYRIRYSLALSADPGFALIPAGSFQMGDAMGDGYTSQLPVHTVNVSGFYMEKNLVTKAQWDGVYTWAVAHGYVFDNVGSGKAANHPVQTVNWYDCVKWCNARSEKDGLVPSYTVGGTTYKTGQSSPVCNMGASGYRLPTEAEWEKAARGGLSGKRFPWGDTISRSQANYYGYTGYYYDHGPNGYNPTYNDGVLPYTSPVGSFEANGYGLYDMAGNVWEWCWDWMGSYGSGEVSDPSGPASGLYRVVRGGSWPAYADRCGVANRFSYFPASGDGNFGFRVVCSSVP